MTLTSRPAAPAAPSRPARLGSLAVPGALLALVTAAVVSTTAAPAGVVHAIQLVVTAH